MKIGIMTFYWVPNYGAVLQAYALQSYLRSVGHEAMMIGYKPYNRDFNLRNFILNRKLPHPVQYVKEWRKDNVFEDFRSRHILCTRRYGNIEELRADPPQLDIYMAGSDQIMHPRTLMKGERRPSPAYMLDFGGKDVFRAGYAVSFGVESYPEAARSYASAYINNYDLLSVREKSGIAVASSIGYDRQACLVPDPTLLVGSDIYKELTYGLPEKGYTAVYLLHGRNSMLKPCVKNDFGKVMDILECPVEEWLSGIRCADRMITNSFHGAVFAILFHIPFVAILEKGAMSGMNDRFTTLLGECGLLSRAVSGYESEELKRLFATEIDWNAVDSGISSYRKVGQEFIDRVIDSARLCRGIS